MNTNPLRRPPEDRVRLVEADHDHAVGTLHNLLIIVWRRETLASAVERAAVILRVLLLRFPDGVGLLQVAEPTTTPPDSAARGALGKMLKEGEKGEGKKGIVCSAVVYTGTGFWMAAARAFVTGMTMLSKLGFPHVIFATVPEAADWHARLLSDEHTSRGAILAAVQALTEAIDRVG